MDQPKPVNKVLISIIVLVVLAGATAGVVYFTNKNESAESTANARAETSASDTTVDPGVATATISYKDGTYDATGSYQTPGGTESVDVSLTLKGDVITDVTVTGSGSDGDTEFYQNKFISNYKSSVVGKDIDTVRLSRVAGSSLTSGGFNKAIESIKQDASA